MTPPSAWVPTPGPDRLLDQDRLGRGLRQGHVRDVEGAGELTAAITRVSADAVFTPLARPES
jgi:hypothetical protein